MSRPTFQLVPTPLKLAHLYIYLQYIDRYTGRQGLGNWTKYVHYKFIHQMSAQEQASRTVQVFTARPAVPTLYLA